MQSCIAHGAPISDRDMQSPWMRARLSVRLSRG
jgi:hypothetical protein